MTVRTFIDRPVLSGVISVLIVILGLLGLWQLPIEQFPGIAPPTVRVSATYTGANAETVQKSVIVPLEESLNGVENMMYMTSTATNTGTASITIFFRQGTDADMAVVNVQNRVASAQGLLPAEVTKSGVTVRKRQNSTLKSITLYSPDDTYDSKFLTNYMKINIEPQISRIAGVGEVNIFSAEYAMRIWLDPAKMSQYGLVAAAVSAAKARFRPIIMTSATMVFGMLPLMFASGVGANGNISVGVGAVGGLLFGTLALLFFVPVLFVVFQYLHERIMPSKRRSPQ